MINTLKDTAPFLILTSIVLFAAAVSFSVIAMHLPLFDVLLLTLRLGVLGDFSLDELLAGDSDTVMVYTWFLIIALVLTILLMNLLIGVLSTNYDRWEEQSLALFVKERATIIVTLCSYPYFEEFIFPA